MSVALFAQYDDATSTLKNENNQGKDDPMTQIFAEDVIVNGSIGVGLDVPSNYAFGFSTIALLENNLRILFDDTSVGTFPANDWQLTANSNLNGGESYFRIDDVTAGTAPFTVSAGAGNNALFISGNGGNVGLGTASPVVELHVADGDTPTMRLEQNASSGFTAQTWDVAGNESNFFVRDVTNGSLLPFKIKPGAPTGTLYLAANGNVGLGTENPEHKLEVNGDAQVNSFFYFGDESTDGNWRVSVVAGKLTFEKREAGVWVSKIEME